MEGKSIVVRWLLQTLQQIRWKGWPNPIATSCCSSLSANVNAKPIDPMPGMKVLMLSVENYLFCCLEIVGLQAY
jgi:hypothetical protein